MIFALYFPLCKALLSRVEVCETMLSDVNGGT